MKNSLKVGLAALALAAGILGFTSCGKKDAPPPPDRYMGQPTTRGHAPGYGIVSFTGSMKPTFQGGEIFGIAKWPFEDVQVGEIIVVWWEGLQINVVHRVIAIRHDRDGKVVGLVTKGDANMSRDHVICTKENFVGLVIWPPQ